MAMATPLGEPKRYEVLDSTGAFIDKIPFDSFDTGEKIGSGSFGKVIKAKHVIYNDVAIKILSCEGRNYDEVLTEATKLRKLCAYPSIICLHCVTSCDENRFGIVMEWMKLGNLKNFQQKKIKDFPWALRMRMLKEVSEGMYYLHYNDIIHRDLKAENIFVQDTLSVKIGDFGLSKSMQSMLNFKPGGTPTHMPPEYFNKKQQPNKKWDVYSFGILQYEVASGKSPFIELENDLQRLEYFVVEQKTRPGICETYPVVVNQLMEKCWDHNPENRPDFEVIKLEIRKVYETKYEISILEAIIKVLTQLKDEQCITQTDARMSKLPTTFRGMQIASQGGSAELVTGNETNKETAIYNQVSEDQSDKFQKQTPSYVNKVVRLSTGRPIPATESHRETITEQASMSPRQPANSYIKSLPEIKCGDEKLNRNDIKCVIDHLQPKDFITLGESFGLKHAQIEGIKEDYRYHNDQVRELIEKWQRKNGKRTRRQLCECLLDVDRSLIDELNIIL